MREEKFVIKLEISIDRDFGNEEMELRFNALPICEKIIAMATRGRATIVRSMESKTVGKQRARRNKRKKSK